MDKFPIDPAADLPAEAAPTGHRARLALRAALTLLVPLARWLVHNGVPYSSFAPALKPVFVEAARQELAGSGGKLTDSALSVLSGVHRRDIRAMGTAGQLPVQPKSPSVASQVFTRWFTDAQLRDQDDRPMPLPKSGGAVSFDGLARQVSSDVHPRTLLAEMQRLGLVQVDADTVRLQAQAFVPQQGFDEMVELFAANAADHLAAASHNLRGDGEKFLEQSVFASGLSPRSTQTLGALARKLWRSAFQQMVREATPRYQQDSREQQGSMRMRFGVYFYAEPLIDADGHAPTGPGLGRSPPRRTATKTTQRSPRRNAR
ncbi:MAG: hypothetical protein HS128_14570 [Ideonella sp.]|nr:hypothetical protein [Ideonella sp.]MCC7456185.1 hypothetical protein [Nitrospira sp.]